MLLLPLVLVNRTPELHRQPCPCFIRSTNSNNDQYLPSLPFHLTQCPVYSRILLTPDTWRINRRPHRHHPARGLRKSNNNHGTTAVHHQSICTIPTSAKVLLRCRRSSWDLCHRVVQRARANYPHCTTPRAAAAAATAIR